MKRINWIFVFIILLLADLVVAEIADEAWRYATKPLLIPVLLFYFLSKTYNLVSSLKEWIIPALIFSWAGDVLLMFETTDPLFFLLGLSSFLTAHIFYIVSFSRIKSSEKIRARWGLIFPVAVYYAGLIYLLYPFLGEMKVPVILYGLIISSMLFVALHMLFIKDKNAGRMLVTGALLFVISDSVLAIDKFYQSFSLAGLIIMLTYGLAQLCIVSGVIRYIIYISKR